MPKATCSVDDCMRDHCARGYCSAHYYRWWQTGDPGPAEFRGPRGTCSVESCSKSHYCRGFCRAHYSRNKRYGDPLGGRRRLPGTDGPSYVKIHAKLRYRDPARNHGCLHCGSRARDWAYNHENPDPDELTDPEKGFRFSMDPRFYIPLCKSCHAKFDNSQANFGP